MRRGIPSLTGVRGVASLWVVFYHMQDAATRAPQLRWLTHVTLAREGFRGVDLFFLLSGFILMYVHQDDFRTLTWPSLRRFFLSRFLRVYPLNAVVLLMIIAVAYAYPSFFWPRFFTLGRYLKSFLLAQRWFLSDISAINGPAWSLSVEILGYLAFPVIVLYLNRIRSARTHLGVAVASLCLMIAASVLLGFADRNITGRLAILRMAPAFAAGCALAAYFLAHRADARSWTRRHMGSVLTASLLAGIAVCSVPSLSFLAILSMAGVVLGLAYEQGPVNRLMASGPVVWLGKISFSLYLTHFTVVRLMAWTNTHIPRYPAGFGPALYSAVMLCVVILVGAVVYYLFERPIAKLVRPLLRSPREPPFGGPRSMDPGAGRAASLGADQRGFTPKRVPEHAPAAGAPA